MGRTLGTPCLLLAWLCRVASEAQGSAVRWGCSPTRLVWGGGRTEGREALGWGWGTRRRTAPPQARGQGGGHQVLGGQAPLTLTSQDPSPLKGLWPCSKGPMRAGQKPWGPLGSRSPPKAPSSWSADLSKDTAPLCEMAAGPWERCTPRPSGGGQEDSKGSGEPCRSWPCTAHRRSCRAWEEKGTPRGTPAQRGLERGTAPADADRWVPRGLEGERGGSRQGCSNGMPCSVSPQPHTPKSET